MSDLFIVLMSIGLSVLYMIIGIGIERLWERATASSEGQLFSIVCWPIIAIVAAINGKD